MKVFYGTAQAQHAPQYELHRGQLVPYFEKPERAANVLAALQSHGFTIEQTAKQFPDEHLTRVHDPAFVHFLATLHSRWRQLHGDEPAQPHTWCVRRMRQAPPEDLHGQLGYYCYDAGTPVTSGTWTAARSGVNIALSAMQVVLENGGAAFALVRPPGHHAGRDFFGGYCYLNNAAIAAQFAIDQGVAKVAVLDVDYHHGNGTQDIFWQRQDVLTVSLHGDPNSSYPYFSGFANELGEGQGAGSNLNLPMPAGTGGAQFLSALGEALRRIEGFDPGCVVVPLGLDTFDGDPIADFRLAREDFRAIGSAIATLERPVLFVLEGGYDVAQLGDNVVALLQGFAQ